MFKASCAFAPIAGGSHETFAKACVSACRLSDAETQIAPLVERVTRRFERLSQKRRPPRLLIVEDNAGLAASMSRAFSAAIPGVEVVVAHDAHAAIDALGSEEGFCAALVDAMLGGVGPQGVDVLRAIPRETRVALVSGHPLSAEMANTYHCQWHLRKPFDTASLAELIESVRESIAPAAL